MRPETAACLADARLACERIIEVTQGLTSEEYAEDWRVQSITERLFTIIGEAIIRIRDLEPPIFHRLPDVHRIVGFRNFLVHAYDSISPSRVFEIVGKDLPTLLIELNLLMVEADAQGL